MSNNDRETLSALLDNEADELELRRILNSSQHNPELLASWDRMNLVQALLHDDNLKSTGHIPGLGSNFSSRVAEAIASEASPVANNSKSFLGQSLAKMGIAASVALAFFLGMQMTFDQQNPGNSGSNPVAQQSMESAVEPASEVMLVESTPVEVNPEARQRLEDYIRSVSITPEEPVQLEQLQDSPLYRLVNDIQNNQ